MSQPAIPLPPQEELDRLCGVAPADRAALRDGRMPESLQRGARSLVVVPIIAAGLGAAAGAFFYWNIHLLVPWGPAGYGVGAALGALAAWLAFRSRFGALAAQVTAVLKHGRVESDVLTLRLERLQGRARFVAADGRPFQAPLRFASTPPFEATLRVFWVDTAAVQGAASPFAEPRLLVALEHP